MGPPISIAEAVDPKKVMDLTRHFSSGFGQWAVPSGSWTILRLGHAATGMKNRPATVAGLGLEVDKLDENAVNRYIQTLLARLEKAGVLNAGSMNAILMDSWEAEHQNWTPLFVQEFKRRRGYDPMPFVPAMSGIVVGDSQQSDRFLWDVRRTIADLLADYHYGVIAEALHARGLVLEGEAVGQGMPMTADQLQTRGRTDVPMGEFWVPPKGHRLVPKADCKEAASAAHIYGKKLVGAEAFSSGPDLPAWSQSPRSLKAVGDLHFATGINRLSLHQYTLQTDESKRPGLTLEHFGSPFNRLNTWWEASGAWFKYLARAQFMLQQGWFVGDVLYFYGEGAPSTVPESDEIIPPLVQGRGYDFVNTEALTRHASVKSGELHFVKGRGYKVLVLPSGTQATLELARTLEKLVRAGATILGEMPTRSPSLAGGANAERSMKTIARKLWGNCVANVPCEHPVGKGRVVTGYLPDIYLRAKSIPLDVEIEGATPSDGVVQMHRQTPGLDYFFLANITEQPQSLRAIFRVEAKSAQLWFPETNEIIPTGVALQNGRSAIEVRLRPLESVFVILRKDVAAEAFEPVLTKPQTRTLGGPWQVKFESATRGTTPGVLTMSNLRSLADHDDPLVRHFAGTALYQGHFNHSGHPEGALVSLDLGDFNAIATVTINGSAVGSVWNIHCLDITKFVRVGANDLQIAVATLWPNRLIGDAAMPVEKRSTWTTFQPYASTSPLSPSGLLGPVQLHVHSERIGCHR